MSSSDDGPQEVVARVSDHSAIWSKTEGSLPAVRDSWTAVAMRVMLGRLLILSAAFGLLAMSCGGGGGPTAGQSRPASAIATTSPTTNRAVEQCLVDANTLETAAGIFFTANHVLSISPHKQADYDQYVKQAQKAVAQLGRTTVGASYEPLRQAMTSGLRKIIEGDVQQSLTQLGSAENKAALNEEVAGKKVLNEAFGRVQEAGFSCSEAGLALGLAMTNCAWRIAPMALLFPSLSLRT